MPLGLYTLGGPGILTLADPIILGPVPRPPVLDTRYGTEVSCLVDLGSGAGLDPLFRLLMGAIIVAEAVVRRWIAEPGDFDNDLNSGARLLSYLNRDMSPGDVAQLAQQLRSEALRDDRVTDCSVVAELVSRRLTIRGHITPSKGTRFRYVFDAVNLTLDILEAA